MIIAPFEANDLQLLREQKATQYLAPYLPAAQAKVLEGVHSYTAWVDGVPLISAGLVEYWPGRCEAWATIAYDAGKHFVAITRAVRRYLNVAPFDRIEAHVDLKFAQAPRWAAMLGFTLECALKPKYFPNGNDAACYVMVR